MKKIYLTLAILAPLFSRAGIQCTGQIGFIGQSHFSITEEKGVQQFSWRVQHAFPNLTFTSVGEVLLKLDPTFAGEVLAIQFNYTKSRCLGAFGEPLLHSCNVAGTADPAKAENVTFALTSGQTLVMKAVPTVVVTIEDRLAVDIGMPGQTVTHRKFHATLYLGFLKDGRVHEYATVFDVQNNRLGIGSCRPG